jgi:hypothetical protein
LSFSNASRRTGSAGKGSPKKKTGKKKQGFHSTKRRLRQADELDLDKLRERTISGLEHLGHQKFSVDKGSYGMEGWVKSLGLLLEDFESKLEESQLPSGYLSQKEQLMRSLSAPVDSSELDAKVESIRSEEVAIRTKLEREKERILARLSEMRTQNERQSKELEAEKSKLIQLNTERQSASFFSKLMGRGGPPTEPVETKIEELGAALKALEDEETGLNTARDSIERRGTDSPDPYADDWRRLNDIAEQIVALEGELQQKLQREKERADAADSLAKMVASVKALPAEPEGK